MSEKRRFEEKMRSQVDDSQKILHRAISAEVSDSVCDPLVTVM